MASAGAVGQRGTAETDRGWLTCLGEERIVRDGAVVCPIWNQPVPVTACVACHHLETVGGERRDDTFCSLAEEVSPPGPR